MPTKKCPLISEGAMSGSDCPAPLNCIGLHRYALVSYAKVRIAWLGIAQDS